jgi:nitrogen fixation/metabolism regulation signal transduction histidine kinase
MLSYTRKKSGKTFNGLYDQLDRINNYIQEVKVDLYNQETFNKLIISQVDIGIIVFDQNGSVKLFNDATLKLLNLQVLTHIKQLNKIQEDLDKLIMRLEPESQKTIKLIIDEKIRQMLFRVNMYKRQDILYRVITFQDIKHELDLKEMESWQKLIRILTHEINNSIGPINSTIDTISGFFTEDKKMSKSAAKIDQKTIDNAVKGIGIIKDRSVGLLDFVQKFRDLTLIPKPELAKMEVMEMFESIQALFSEKLGHQGIRLSINVNPESLSLFADRSLLEQVMINLLKNAVEAGGKTIEIMAFKDEGGKSIIQIKDDGEGIDKDTIENIFVPFYTTKSDGSGIGLSFSREILRIHQGHISVSSVPGKHTEFSLVFRG